MTTDDDAKVATAFEETEERADHHEFCNAVRAALDAGKTTAELPTAFLARVIDQLQTVPTMFDTMRDVWNRCCDEQGRPDEKIKN